MRLTFYSGLFIMAINAIIEQPVEALSLADQHPDFDNLAQIDAEINILGAASSAFNSVKNRFTGGNQQKK